MIINKFETLSSGIEKLESDLNLIQTYADSTIGCGMESLDAPSDKLAERYFATAYPDHYKLGSGQEGIKDLIEKIKSGIKGLKNILKSGKADPLLKSTTKAVSGEVKKTYGSDAWIEKQAFKFGKVSVPELAKVVAGGTIEEVKAALDSQIELFTNTLADQLKALKEHWGKVEGPLKKALAMVEKGTTDTDEYEAAIDALLKVIGTGNPTESKEVGLPEFPVASDSSYQAATKETTKDISDMIESIMKACDKLEEMASVGRLEDCAGQEIFVEWGDKVSKDDEKKIFALYFDVYQHGPTERANVMSTQLFNVARALEQWILASLK